MSTCQLGISTCSQESLLHVSYIYMFARMHVDHIYACRPLMHVVYLTCQPLYAFNWNCMSCAMAHVVMSTYASKNYMSTCKLLVVTCWHVFEECCMLTWYALVSKCGRVAPRPPICGILALLQLLGRTYNSHKRHEPPIGQQHAQCGSKTESSP